MSGGPLHDYFAVSAAGLEPATASELGRLGAHEIRLGAGGVGFSADLATLYRTLLWLRSASRVLRPLREFAAGSAEMLYSQTRRARWEDWLDPTKTFAVHATLESKKSWESRGERRPASAAHRGTGRRGIDNSMFAALKIKDAICDRLRHEQGSRPNVDRDSPDLLVHAHFAGGRCRLSLDAVGGSLHERGYRIESVEAPLKETLAAGIIELTGWDGTQPFYDPFCGSGTLVIEAAQRALQIAPGLSRSDFACQRWPDFDAGCWNDTRQTALSLRRHDLPSRLTGTDVDPRAIDAACRNAAQAGVASAVDFTVRDVREMAPPAAPPSAAQSGTLVANPPYGERLGEAAELESLYRRFGELLRERFTGWTAWALVGNMKLARHIDLAAVEKIKLFNGPLPCRLLKFAL